MIQDEGFRILSSGEPHYLCSGERDGKRIWRQLVTAVGLIVLSAVALTAAETFVARS
jgi:hypothetical protein